MGKLITDLKKFGYSGAKNLTQDSIKTGYGDSVCHIIDELLNLELYRREFQFFNPIFPPDTEDEGEEEEGYGDGNEDSVILINGEIEAREIKESPGNEGKVKRKMIGSNIEETKINFFDPSQYQDQ